MKSRSAACGWMARLCWNDTIAYVDAKSRRSKIRDHQILQNMLRIHVSAHTKRVATHQASEWSAVFPKCYFTDTLCCRGPVPSRDRRHETRRCRHIGVHGSSRTAGRVQTGAIAADWTQKSPPPICLTELCLSLRSLADAVEWAVFDGEISGEFLMTSLALLLENMSNILFQASWNDCQ